jgi:hypothetical protein
MRSVKLKSVLVVIAFIGVAAIEAAAAWLLPRHDDTATGIQSHRDASEPGTQPGVQSTQETVIEAQALRTIQASHPTTPGHIDSAARYYTTDDYFDEFDSQAAPEALAGDDRAPFYDSWALSKCLGPMGEYQASSNPEADFNTKLAAEPPLSKWAVEQRRLEFHSCVGYAKADAFNHLPGLPEGSALPRYGITQAYSDRDPRAVAYYAADELSSGTAGDGAQSLDSSQLDLELAVASGDPAAIFHVGEIFLFAGTRYGASPVAGAALIIAGCDLGYDCSASSPALDFYLICVSARGCPSGFTYLDGVREALGESKYAAAYSRAKQFEQALQKGDRAALRPFVPINGASRRGAR